MPVAGELAGRVGEGRKAHANVDGGPAALWDYQVAAEPDG